MRVNLYYAPYPSQVFEGELEPISPIRVWNPKSALVTLAAGVRKYLDEWGIEASLRIIDTQIDDGTNRYRSFTYGPRTIDCYRVGGEFELYDDRIREAEIHGISNNYTNSAGIVVDFARHIKAVSPNALIVVGGMDATARPEFYLERGADVVVLLEGEHSFAKVVESRARGLPLTELPGSRRHGDGVVVASTSLLDLDDLPPMSLELVEQMEKYADTGEGIPPPSVQPPFACLETSRGCYQRCSYCATPMRGKYRFMSPAAIERHFAHLRSVGINNILFQEDNILSRIQRSGKGTYIHDQGRAEVLEIFQMARDYGFSWEFCNGLEFGKFLDSGAMDRALMAAMFWSDRSGPRWRGCYRVQIPLEVLSDAPTIKLPKLRKFDEELEILAAIMDFGVQYQTFNVIIGHDGDDDRALSNYLERCLYVKDALQRMRTDVVAYFNIFNRTLLPGTQDFRVKKHLLQFDIDRDPEVIGVYLAPMNTEHLNYYDLFEWRVRMTSEINGSLIDQYDGTFCSPRPAPSEIGRSVPSAS